MSNSQRGGRPEPLDEQWTLIRKARNSHCILVAGPGTGKTFTLERTAEHLVEECEVSPDEIALLTLTRSMAGSLGERIPHGRAETLHSFALRHLNRIGQARDRRVADAWEVTEMVRSDLQLGVLEEFEVEVTLGQVGDYLDELGKAFRDTQEEPRDLRGVNAQIHRVFQHQREFFQYRLMDELVVDLLEHLERGGSLASPPTYLLVDEYQDLNPGELRLLRTIAEQHESIVVACGDDRQSIYGFREADHLALHRFPSVYAVEEVDYLFRSARCPAVICRFAEAVAEPLPALPGIDRPSLQPWPGRESEGELRVLSAPSPVTEARWVLDECERLINEGDIAPNEIMVIAASFFTDVFRQLAEEAEAREALAFHLYDPREQDPAGNQPAVRVLSAGLRLLDDSEDQMAWRTLEWAAPGIGIVRRRSILGAGERSYRRALESVAEADGACRRVLEAGRGVIAEFGDEEEIHAEALLEFLLEALDLEFDDMTGVAPLLRGVGPSAPRSEWLTEIRRLAQGSLLDPAERPDGIPVRTVFGAKGLEAPVVFLLNAMEASFTGYGQVADGIRRLYVALSRTEGRLYITAPRFIGYTSLEHAAGTRYGGLYDLIADAAERIGVEIEQID